MPKLIQYRKSIGKSPTEMAREMGVSKWFYYKVEGGLRNPSYNFLKKFKEAFKVNIDNVFFS